MCLLNPQSHPCLPVGDSLDTRRRHHLDKYSTCKLVLAMQEHPYFNSGITIIATITTVNVLHPTQWKFHCPSERGLRPTHTTIQTQNCMDLTFLASIHTSHSALDGTFGTHSPAHKRESTTRCNEEGWKAKTLALREITAQATVRSSSWSIFWPWKYVQAKEVTIAFLVTEGTTADNFAELYCTLYNTRKLAVDLFTELGIFLHQLVPVLNKRGSSAISSPIMKSLSSSFSRIIAATSFSIAILFQMKADWIE